MVLDPTGLKQLLNKECVGRIFCEDEVNLTASKTNNPYEWIKISNPFNKKI